MAKRRVTEPEIAEALRQAEAGVPVRQIISRLDVSEQTFYRWKRKFRSGREGDLWRFREIEEENRKLKQLVAELTLENHKLRDMMGGRESRGAKSGLRRSSSPERD